MKVQDLQTTENVKAFIDNLLNEPPYYLGLSFHIDTPFSEYINYKKEPLFSKSEAIRLEIMLGKCIEICDNESVDIYELALDLMKDLSY
jgi:hypothetical protein